MTPLLIIALPDSQAPIVWWASDAYVTAAVARLASKRLAPEITQRHRRDEEKTHRGAYELRRGVVEAPVHVQAGPVQPAPLV